jgi:hypothetical protein
MHILKRIVLHICYLFFYVFYVSHFITSENVQVLWDITVEATGNLTEKSSSIRNVLLYKTFYHCPNVLWTPVFELHMSESVPPSLSLSFIMTDASRPVLVKLDLNYMLLEAVSTWCQLYCCVASVNLWWDQH